MGELALGSGDGLLVVDVQHDFLPGGALGIPGGDAVIPALNDYVAAFVARGLPVLASRDWHPGDHCSFRERGGPWPPHCVAGTWGAELSPDLVLPPGTPMVSKATDPEREAYSAFQGTELDARLRALGVRRLFIGGLATDYCVLETVRDARARGYEAVVLADAICAVNVRPGDGRRAEEEMARLGAIMARREALRP